MMAILVSFFMIAAQVGTTATRDALFLSTFAASKLPLVMVTAALLSIAAAFAMSRLMSRFGPSRLLPLVFATNAVLFTAEWRLIAETRGVIAVLLYLHTSVCSVLLISGFWAVINERFDPHSAKTAVSRIGAGAALGGIAGGFAADRVAALLDLPSMLIILGAVNLLTALGATRIGTKSGVEGNSSDEQWWFGIQSISSNSYLRHMASLVIGVAAIEALIEYTFKSEAASWMRDDASLMSFFAVFYTATAVLTFAVQSTLSTRALTNLGLAGTIAVLPGFIVVIGVLAAALPRLWTVVFLCGAEAVLTNTLFRSGYELLYTPLSTDQKRPVKILIDVAFKRMGGAIGSGLVLLLLQVIESPERILIGSAIALSTAALWNCYRLHHGYVQALADSLRSGAVALSDSEIVDATTKRTLSDTTHALNRERLLIEIQAYQMQQRQKESEGIKHEGADPEQPSYQPEDTDSLKPLITDLLSNDTNRIRNVLVNNPLDTRAASLVIPLLGHPQLAKSALRCLRSIAPHIVGQLTDALLDPDLSPVIRGRIPRVIKTINDQRAMDGLLRGLSDDLFDVRNACAVAMTELKQRNGSLRVSQRKVFAAVSRELRLDKSKDRRALDREPNESNSATENRRSGMDVVKQNLEYVFNLLGLVMDRESLQNSLRALQSDDTYLRGTSLEYLENVLPEWIRKEIWPNLVS